MGADLDIHDDRHSQQAAQVDGKVEPVEEALLLLPVLHNRRGSCSRIKCDLGPLICTIYYTQ